MFNPPFGPNYHGMFMQRVLNYRKGLPLMDWEFKLLMEFIKENGDITSKAKLLEKMEDVVKRNAHGALQFKNMIPKINAYLHIT